MDNTFSVLFYLVCLVCRTPSKPDSNAPTLPKYLKYYQNLMGFIYPLCMLHLAAYATSALVRYHPGYWAMLLGCRQGDSIAPVLSAALAAVEERYPELIMEAIGG